MRRVFVIRKDLNLKPGKLAAMVGHCAEGYFTNLLKTQAQAPFRFKDNEFDTLLAHDPWHPDQPALYRHPAIFEAAQEAFKKGEETFKWPAENSRPTVSITVEIPKDIWEGYINDIFMGCRKTRWERLQSAAIRHQRGIGWKRIHQVLRWNQAKLEYWNSHQGS